MRSSTVGSRCSKVCGCPYVVKTAADSASGRPSTAAGRSPAGTGPPHRVSDSVHAPGASDTSRT